MKPGHLTSEFWLVAGVLLLAAGAWLHLAHAGPLQPDTSLHHCGLVGLATTLAALAVRRYLDVRVFLKTHVEEENGPREPAREFGFGQFVSADELEPLDEDLE